MSNDYEAMYASATVPSVPQNHVRIPVVTSGLILKLPTTIHTASTSLPTAEVLAHKHWFTNNNNKNVAATRIIGCSVMLALYYTQCESMLMVATE